MQFGGACPLSPYDHVHGVELTVKYFRVFFEPLLCPEADAQQVDHPLARDEYPCRVQTCFTDDRFQQLVEGLIIEVFAQVFQPGALSCCFYKIVLVKASPDVGTSHSPYLVQ